MSTLVCPLCKRECEAVSSGKVYGSVKAYFRNHVKSSHYGYCQNEDCDIVYFGLSNDELYFNRDFEERIK